MYVCVWGVWCVCVCGMWGKCVYVWMCVCRYVCVWMVVVAVVVGLVKELDESVTVLPLLNSLSLLDWSCPGWVID